MAQMGNIMGASLRFAAMGLAFAGFVGASSIANAADVYRRETGGGLKDDVVAIVATHWAGPFVCRPVGYWWGGFYDRPGCRGSQAKPPGRLAVRGPIRCTIP